jgi:hypothetical protein
MRPFWRRDPLALLGTGVWRRAHDRFRRAVDRYHQMLEQVPVGPAREALEVEGARLGAALDRVLVTCRSGQLAWPSAAFDIPPAAGAVHRALSRAATSAAQASESAAMARVAARAGDAETAAARAQSAGRAVAESLAWVATAETALPA